MAELGRDVIQQKFVLLVKAGELDQSGKGLRDTRKTIVLILNDETIFIIKSTWSLNKKKHNVVSHLVGQLVGS